MKKIIALVMVCTLAVSGCGLFKKDPQKAVNDGVAKMADVKKMSSSLTMSGTISAPPGEKPAKIQFSLQSAGKTDLTDEKVPVVDVTLKLSGSMDDQSASADVALKAVDKKIFAKIASLEISGEAGKSLKGQLGSFINTWWSLPMGEESALGKFTQENKEVTELFRTTAFFKNVVEDVQEDVQGVKSTKYRVEVDKDALKKFVLDVGRLTGNQVTPEEETAVGESLKDVEFSGAVWVGDDGKVHRIKGTIASQPKQGPSSSFEIDYMGWEYGKDVVVAQPEGAQEFNTLMMLPLLGAFGAFDEPSVEDGATTTPKPEMKPVVPAPKK